MFFKTSNKLDLIDHEFKTNRRHRRKKGGGVIKGSDMTLLNFDLNFTFDSDFSESQFFEISDTNAITTISAATCQYTSANALQLAAIWAHLSHLQSQVTHQLNM